MSYIQIRNLDELQDWLNKEYLSPLDKKNAKPKVDYEAWNKLSEEEMKNTESDYDYVNPTHYKKSGKEVWEMMVDIWGVEAFILHCEMNAFKYRMRLGDKPEQPVQRDLEKAQWYENKAKELRKLNR